MIWYDKLKSDVKFNVCFWSGTHCVQGAILKKEKWKSLLTGAVTWVNISYNPSVINIIWLFHLFSSDWIKDTRHSLYSSCSQWVNLQSSLVYCISSVHFKMLRGDSNKTQVCVRHCCKNTHRNARTFSSSADNGLRWQRVMSDSDTLQTPSLLYPQSPTQASLYLLHHQWLSITD